MQIVEIGSAFQFNPEMYIRTRADSGNWSPWYMMAGKRDYSGSVSAVDGTLSNVTAWYYNNMLTLSCKYTASADKSAADNIIKLDRIHLTPENVNRLFYIPASGGILLYANTPDLSQTESYILTNAAINNGSSVYLNITLPCNIVTI